MKKILSLVFVVAIAFPSESQINLASGSARFDIPIFNYKDDKSGLATSIGLFYNSGNGLRVNEIASSVGQGWQLNIGGFIQRRQNGEPDDQNSKNSFPAGTNICNVNGCKINIANWAEQTQDVYNYINNYYPNGYLHSEYPVSQDLSTYTNDCAVPRELAFNPRYKNSMDKRWKLSRRALADRMQDVFSFSFNGRYGEFVIGKDGSFLTLDESKLKIEKVEADLTGLGIRTKIKEFIITDEMGTKYRFSSYETSTITRQNLESSQSGDFSFSVYNSSTIGQKVIDRWMLTEIINPLTNEKIVFNYSDANLDFLSDLNVAYQKIESGANKEGAVVAKIRAVANAKRLTGIIFPDGRSVGLTYLYYSREDMQGDLPLASISVNYLNSTSITWKFNYKYFFKKGYQNIGNAYQISGDDKRFLRLALVSIQKTGSNNAKEPPYLFEYYTGDDSNDPKDLVPPLRSFAQDHWGFYNKASNVGLNDIIPSKEVIRDLMVNPYPYRNAADNAARYGLLKSVNNPSGGTTTWEYEQNDCLNPATGSNIQVGGVRVKKITQYSGFANSNLVMKEYTYTNGSNLSSGWGYETPLYFFNRNLHVYKDANGFKYGGVQVNDIKAVILKQIIQIGIQKGITAIAGSAAFASIGPQFFLAAFMYVMGGVVERMFLLFNPEDDYNTKNYSFYPVWYSNPKGIHFSRVEEKNALIFPSDGVIVHEFTAPLNNSEIGDLGFPYTNKTRYPSWKYDLLKKVTYKNGNGSTIKEIINDYSTVANPYTNANFLSCKTEANQIFSSDCWDATYAINASNITHDFYYPIVGKAQLTQTTEKNYGIAGTSSETIKSYTYNSLNNQIRNIQAIDSRGNLTVETTYYSCDYNVPGAITTMKNSNAIAVPVSTAKCLVPVNGGGSYKVLNATVNEYVTLSNGNIKLQTVYKSELATPIYKSLAEEVFDMTNLKNYSFLKPVINYKYNSSDNLSEYYDEQGRNNALIYDYNNRLVTAIIRNATQDEVAYTSFEGGGKGQWQLPSENIIEDFAPTGTKCFKYPVAGTSKIFKQGLNSQKNYILSFWAKDGSLFVYKHNQVFATYSPQKSYTNTSTGWTYYEYLISSATGIDVDNSLNGNAGGPYSQTKIDEVRLYPEKSVISTSTYNPLIGKTSECDANGHITYYQYDGLGRVKTLKDENLNLVKAYEYNYKTTFYSTAKFIPFIKNNCPPGYIGSTIYYSVPEGKYSSLVSQADADQQADTEVSLNGQSYANNSPDGYCSPPNIYPELSYENIFNSGTETYADVVVRFYSDAAHTIPFSVSNYSLTYHISEACSYGSPNSYSYTVSANGNQVVIGTSLLIYYSTYMWDPWSQTYVWGDCYKDYFL